MNRTPKVKQEKPSAIAGVRYRGRLFSLLQRRDYALPKDGMPERNGVEVPITHLPPGSIEMTRHEIQQLRNVHTAIAGIAVTEGISMSTLSMEVHIPSQNI